MDEAREVHRYRFHFLLFVRDALPGGPRKPGPARGLAKWVDGYRQKALAVQAFTAQNGRGGLEWLDRRHKQIGQILAV